ncbi:MAG: hypothetical protein NWF00_10325 [Candidatus Bathyarchaeota archaeon]|nr:hypothetical protein [Candidatus Bathyarchaeota archaeon]
MSNTSEVENLKREFRVHGAKTVQELLSALLIWLFGILVFIPISASLGSNVELVCTLLILVSFTVLISRTMGNLKCLIDAFAFLPAKKYMTKRGWNYKNATIVSKQILYLVFAVILYLLYLPFLVRIHPAVSGIALIFVIVFVFFLAVRALRASGAAITSWLNS